jgi:cellobiose-specific phosphotransferase system component IIB
LVVGLAVPKRKWKRLANRSRTLARLGAERFSRSWVARAGKRLVYRAKQLSLPLRSPKKPLKIVFVCLEGFSSSVHSEKLRTELERANITAIQVSNSFVMHEISPKDDSIRWRSEKEVRNDLRKADIVVHPFEKRGQALLVLLRNIPKRCLTLTYLEAGVMQKRYQGLWRAIHDRFRIRWL